MCLLVKQIDYRLFQMMKKHLNSLQHHLNFQPTNEVQPSHHQFLHLIQNPKTYLYFLAETEEYLQLLKYHYLLLVDNLHHHKKHCYLQLLARFHQPVLQHIHTHIQHLQVILHPLLTQYTHIHIHHQQHQQLNYSPENLFLLPFPHTF